MATRMRGSARRVEDAAKHPAREAREKAQSGSGWYAWVARTGLVAKGVSYGIVAVLAIEVAVGARRKATSRGGALQSLAQHSWGKVLLVALAAGFAAYAMWRFVQAFAEREDEGGEKGEAKKWGKRAGFVGRGLVYAGLTYTALKIVAGAGAQQSQNEKAKKTTAMVFDWPAGRWIVAIAGIVIFAAGLWNLYCGITHQFEDEWRTGEMRKTERKWGGRAGLVGHLARAVVFGLIGIFVTKAAISYDSNDAIGLDGALQKLANASYGPYLLALTAAGVFCFGLFCLVDARYRDVSANGGSSSERGSRRRTASLTA